LQAAVAVDARPPDTLLSATIQPATRDRLEDNPLECPRWRTGSGRRTGDHAPTTVDRKEVQVLHSRRRIWTRRRDPPPPDLPALPPGGQPGADLDHGRHPAEARRRTERAGRPR